MLTPPVLILAPLILSIIVVYLLMRPAQVATTPVTESREDYHKQYQAYTNVVYSQIWKTLHALGHPLNASGDIKTDKLSRYFEDSDALLTFFIALEERLEAYRADINLKASLTEALWALTVIPDAADIWFIQDAVTRDLIRREG